jgi:hypothetical protein
MERILIRHLSGARAGQVDEFSAAETSEILVGRDPEAAVCFDPGRDDLVSRQHLKIVRDPEAPDEFAVVDMQSRNGTFVNRQRIYAPARLAHNDIIQLGPAGPEFRFELDPPPRHTTRSALVVAPAREGAPATDFEVGVSTAPRPIGRATVERMLGDTFTKVKHESDKAVWVGAAALTAILVVGGVTHIFLRQNAVDANLQAQQSQQMLQQMGQEVKKTPELAEAMRQEVLRLNEQLKVSDARNEEHLKQLSRQLTEQEAATRQAQVAAARQAVRELAGQPASLPAADIPSSTPAMPPAGDPARQPNYQASVRQGVDLLQKGDADGALKVAQQLMQSEPNRWEAYSIAGSVAKVQNKPSQARSMFEKALSLAPDEIKPSLQQALQDIARGGQ